MLVYKALTAFSYYLGAPLEEIFAMELRRGVRMFYFISNFTACQATLQNDNCKTKISQHCSDTGRINSKQRINTELCSDMLSKKRTVNLTLMKLTQFEGLL